jgi:hypothetical protein
MRLQAAAHLNHIEIMTVGSDCHGSQTAGPASVVKQPEVKVTLAYMSENKRTAFAAPAEWHARRVLLYPVEAGYAACARGRAKVEFLRRGELIGAGD